MRHIMLENLTLRKKLITGFLFVSLIAGGIGCFGILQMRSLGEADAYLYENATRPVEYLTKINAGFELAAANIAYCLYERKTGDFLPIADAAMGELSTNIEAYGAALTDAEGRRLYKEMLSRWADYKTYYATLRDLILSGRILSSPTSWIPVPPSSRNRSTNGTWQQKSRYC
jgi:methyl-accepting chemotaxis protein